MQFAKSLSVEVPKGIDVILQDYKGPYSTLAPLKSFSAFNDLGLDIFVGESTQLNGGRGLFVALKDGSSTVTLPRGTPICGYAGGSFTDQAGQGDKTVAFAFYHTTMGVIYDTKLLSLMKVINTVTDSSADLSRVIDGHELYVDNENICISPLDNYPNRYFIPDEATESNAFGPGMFANDLGYDVGITTAEAYAANSLKKNILQIVWGLELEAGVFKPTAPVVILSQDVKFTNTLPMEVGIQYSWRYWLATMQEAAATGPGVWSTQHRDD